MLSPNLLSRIFHINPEPMTLSRFEDGRYIEVNESFLRVFGYSRDEVVGHTAIELGIWDNPDRDRAQIVEQIHSQGYASDIEADFRTRSGEKVRFYLGATRIEEDGEQLLLIVGRDITAIRSSEQALRESEKRFRGFIEHLPLGVVIAQNGIIHFANPTSLEMIGYHAEEIIGRAFSELVHPDDREMVMAYHQRRKEGDESIFCYDLHVLRKDGEVCCWRVHASPSTWEGSVASLAVCTDVTQQKQDELRMAELALHDQVTGLPNRALLASSARQAMSHTARGFAVIYMDLDGFKQVNDDFGHDAGDYVLQEVAQRLLRSVRETDIAARVGGDEFVVLAENIDSCRTAIQVAENIRLLLNRPFQSKVAQHQLSVSVGISLYPSDARQLDQLLQLADEAMYSVKRSGRNRVCCYSDHLTEEAEKS
jgi:diguanylate cyclase (GGDEF)-like protein/PAS domain S-box-containing protein